MKQEELQRFDMKAPPVRTKWYLRPLTLALSLPDVWKHRAKITRVGTQGLKPPYVMLCNHNAFLDFKVATRTIWPQRANYVVAIDGFIGREWLLRQVGCICKRKFTNDLTLIRQLKQVIRNGDVAMIYPEARYSLCGTTAVLPASLGKLCKLLGVPVVTLICHGHHVNSPFWNLHDRGVKPTGEEAFMGLKTLKGVTLCDNVRTIYSRAFANCTKLEVVNWCSTLDWINPEAFANCINLTSADLSNTVVTTIGEKAFKGCSQMTELKLPGTINSIKKQAFSGCSGLPSVTLPGSLYELCDSAFYGCTQLYEVRAEMDNPPYIMPSTFKRVGWKSQLIIPPGTTDRYISKGWTKDYFGAGLKEDGRFSREVNGYRMTFGAFNSYEDYPVVELVGVEAHSYSPSTLVIPKTVTSGDKTYYVRHIATGACQNILGIQSLVLPSSVQKIESKAFQMLNNLTSVTVEGLTVPYIDSDAFPGHHASCQARIPFSEASTYEARGWTTTQFPAGIYPETIFTAETEEGDSVTYKVTGLNPWTVQVGTGDAPAIDVATAGALTLPQTVKYADLVVPSTLTVTTVATGAFENCTGLTTVSLPATLTAIGDRAFGGCSALAEVYSQIREPFTINDQVFTGLPEGAKLYVPQGTEQLYNTAGWYFYFGGGIVNGEVFVEDGMKFLKTGPSTVSVGDGNDPAVDVSTAGALEIPTTVEHDGTTYTVTALSWGAFYGCAALTSVTIPEGITDILPSTFNECTALETVALPSTLLTIQNYAFNGCSALTTINLPEGLVSVHRPDPCLFEHHDPLRNRSFLVHQQRLRPDRAPRHARRLH